MSKFAIGLPGERPRMILPDSTAERAARQCREGETVVLVDIGGPVIIGADGESCLPDPAPPPGPDLIRARRTALLAACDWTQLPDAALDSEQQAAWAEYRQALRDLPESQPGATIDTIVWPDRPGES